MSAPAGISSRQTVTLRQVAATCSCCEGLIRRLGFVLTCRSGAPRFLVKRPKTTFASCFLRVNSAGHKKKTHITSISLCCCQSAVSLWEGPQFDLNGPRNNNH